MGDTVDELVGENAYLRSLRERWSVGFERLRRLDLPGGDEPDANLPAMAADEIERLRGEVERRDDRLLSMGVRIERLEDLVRQLAPHCKGATLNDDHVATARSVPQAHLGGKVELHLLKPVGQADCLCEHTYPADAVALIADACKHDERVRAQVGLLIEPLVDAVSIVADVWSRLPIEARMDIERTARSEEDAHNTMRRLVKGDDRE